MNPAVAPRPTQCADVHVLDGQFKKESEAQVKAGYRILRTLDNDESSWNMLTLREFKSFAQKEADEDAGLRRFSAPAP